MTAQSLLRNHFKYSTGGYLTAAWNHYTAAHTHTRYTNTDAYCTCI